MKKVFVAFICILALLSVTPIYDFSKPEPFCGPDVYNPYSGYKDSIGWKKAAFHVHTKVHGLLNECDFWPDYVDSCYRSFGYDIVTFSNHNRLTSHPYDSSLQVNVYEHGFGLYKYHKLVFGSKRVMRYDHLVPFTASHKQFQLDLLSRSCDFLQMNHPFRTGGTSEDVMQKLTGYQIIELDSGVTTEQDYWDWALSAGHYSFALASDDLHYPDRHDRFAVRCSFLNSPSGRYDDIKRTLLGGAYYCMRIPDYGNGDWAVKKEANMNLPHITSIGAESDSIFIRLSSPAFIRVYGKDHSVLKESCGGEDHLEYVLPEDQPYARIQAYFPDGAVIYTNAFARYDSSAADSPYKVSAHKVNVLLTILYNLALALVVAGLFIRKKK